MNDFLKYLKIKSQNFTLAEFLWFCLLMLSLGMIVGGSIYFLFDPSLIVRRQSTTTESAPWVFLHVLFGSIWLLSGLMQFTDYSQKRLKWHRRNGYLYLFCSIVSIFSLFAISLQLQERAPFKLGSVTFALYSLICIVGGFFLIKQKKIENHRAWMIRGMIVAFLMPLDRFNNGLYLTFGIFFEFFHINMSAIFLTELLIHRKLEIPLLHPRLGRGNIPVALILLFVGLATFTITCNAEYQFVRNNIIFAH